MGEHWLEDDVALLPVNSAHGVALVCSHSVGNVMCSRVIVHDVCVHYVHGVSGVFTIRGW